MTRWTGSSGFWVAVAVASAFATGCVVPTDTDSDTDELSRDFVWNPWPVQICFAMPGCSNTAYVTPYVNSLQSQLGCGPTRRFSTGAGAGFLGGLASFCPDNWWTRAQLHNTPYRGWIGAYCNECIDVPAGQMFVFWTSWTGPGCPGGCEPMPPPGGF